MEIRNKLNKTDYIKCFDSNGSAFLISFADLKKILTPKKKIAKKKPTKKKTGK